MKLLIDEQSTDVICCRDAQSIAPFPFVLPRTQRSQPTPMRPNDNKNKINKWPNDG